MNHRSFGTLIGMLLRLYPAALRRNKGREIAQLYGRMWNDMPDRRLARRIAFAVRLVFDLLWNAAAAWRHALQTGKDNSLRNARALRELRSATLTESRLAFRRLVQTPAFTVVAILTLALGVTANTVVFALINGAFLKPLPYLDPDKLVYLREADEQMEVHTSFEAFRHFGDHATSFAALGAFGQATTALRDRGDPVRLHGAMVSANLFSMLGAQPLLGRGFLPGEDEPGGEPVIILSHAVWQTRFGGRPDVVGTRMGSRTIVGVMPPRFAFPNRNDEFWITLRGATRGQPTSRFLTMVGRLAPGTTLEQAGDEAMRVGRQLRKENPPAKGGAFTRVHSLRDREVAPRFKATFAALAVAVLCLLLIVASNLANLLLARASTRRLEFSIRNALGASGARLTLTVMAEPMLLALFGGAAGVVGAYWCTRLVLKLAPAGAIPRAAEVGLSPWVVLFALGVSLLVGLGVGLASLSGASAEKVLPGVRSSGRAFTSRPLQGGFTVAQVAFTFALLAGASLMAKTVANLQTVDLGFNPESAMVVDLSLPASRYGEPALRLAFYEQVEERTGGLPGVAAAGYVSTLPLTGGWIDGAVRVEGNVSATGEFPVFEFDTVSPGFFQAMGIALRRGRLFDTGDREGSLRVALVNETAARLHFPGGVAVGRRIAATSDGEPDWLTVVGVVKDVRHHDLRQVATPKLYVPYSQARSRWPSSVNLVVRTVGLAPLQATRMIRSVIKDVDAGGGTLVEISPLGAQVEGLMQSPRFNALLLVVFTVSALGLAVLGLYATVAFWVAERRKEIAIRMALGADTPRILKETLGRGLRLTSIGVAIGLPLALGMGRALSSMLFGVGYFDPMILGTVTGLVAGACAIASLLPSFNASRIDPAVSLRSD